jgi:hypothetical protein
MLVTLGTEPLGRRTREIAILRVIARAFDERPPIPEPTRDPRSHSPANNQRGSDELLLHAFGRALTDSSSLVVPYEGWKAYDEVKGKSWSDQDRAAIEPRGPFLLAINTSFAGFDPRHDRFAFVWLDDFGSDGADLREKELEAVLRRLAEMARDRDHDLFESIQRLGEQRTRPGAVPQWAFFNANSVASAELTATQTKTGPTT